MLPAWARIAIGRIIEERVQGPSKFARIAHRHAHRLQIQERMVHQIADDIEELARTKNVAVTVAEMASMGGRARAAKYSREQLRQFAKGAGRPAKLDGRARRRLKELLAAGRSQAECAADLGVSTRTVGRAVVRMRAGM